MSRQGIPEAVDALLNAAFDTSAEAELVRALRTDRVLAAEILLPGKTGLEGYAALSRMVAPRGWLCLAPVAVRPEGQRRGTGSRLVEMALRKAEEARAFVVVLGDPGYYGARGFSSVRAARLISSHPAAHMLLAGPGSDAPEAELIYPPAFRNMEG